MVARIHHLAWLVGAILAGASACGGEGGGAKETPPGGTAPGGPDGGAKPAQCVGPAWFGGIAEGKRTTVVDSVCADARTGTLTAGRMSGDAGPSCKGQITVRSDEEINAILASVDEGMRRQGRLGESSASSPAVKEFARQQTVSHARLGEEQKGMLRRQKKSSTSTSDSVSRALDKGFTESETALRNLKGADFDRELVNRQIIQHARSIELYDELASQAKAENVRCEVEKDRDVAMAHLQLACQVLAGLPAPQARQATPRAPVTQAPVQQQQPAEPAQPAAPQEQAPAQQQQQVPATQEQAPAPQEQAPAQQQQAPAQQQQQAPAPQEQAPAQQQQQAPAPQEQAPATQAPAQQQAPVQAQAPAQQQQMAPADPPAGPNPD